jgi:glutathione S-transferase
MLTLFHAPKSRSSRIIWLLEELGAPYEIRIVTIPRQDGTGAPDPANPHPDKKVPAIVHDGVLITESSAITLYLTDAFPQNNIGPKIGDKLRGPYLTWLAYYQGVIEPVVTASFAGFADNDGFSRTFTTHAQVNARISAALDAGPFILGESFSGADILVGSMGQWARAMLPPGDVVDAYLQRVGARPALQRAFAKDAG